MECPHFTTKINQSNCVKCGRITMEEKLASIQISPSATPSRKNNLPPRRPNNSFEKGNRTDERGIAYLNEHGSPMKMGEYFDPRKWETKERNRINLDTHGGK